jgi:hypothetical protein
VGRSYSSANLYFGNVQICKLPLRKNYAAHINQCVMKLVGIFSVPFVKFFDTGFNDSEEVGADLRIGLHLILSVRSRLDYYSLGKNSPRT